MSGQVFDLVLSFLSSRSLPVVLDGKSCKNIRLILVFVKAPLLVYKCTFFFKYTIRPCMEYCCHGAGAPNCYLHIDKLQKHGRRTVGPTFATSFEPLRHHGNVAC